MSKQIQYFYTYEEATALAARLNRKHARKYHFGDILAPSHYYMTDGGDVPVYNKAGELCEEFKKKLREIVDKHDFNEGCTFWGAEGAAIEQLVGEELAWKGVLIYDEEGFVISVSRNGFTHENYIGQFMPFGKKKK